MELGRLTEVNIRELWKHEQYDFSSWLAEEENISLLGDILGLTLVNVNKEVYVGAYRCDLVAQDEATGTKIIIENQLESSNHEHLGKLITYASGLDARIVVWIVKSAREEHRRAIEWLNNNTNRELGFFLIELHAYRIGASLPAPRFEVAEMPNDFVKSVQSTGNGEEQNYIRAEYFGFWEQFNEEVAARGKPFSIRKPAPRQWYIVSIGSGRAYISITLQEKQNLIWVELYIPDDKKLFDQLYIKKREIEEKLGQSLEWNRLEKKKASRIIGKIPGLRFENHSNYEKLINDTIKMVLQMRMVFAEYMDLR